MLEQFHCILVSLSLASLPEVFNSNMPRENKSTLADAADLESPPNHKIHGKTSPKPQNQQNQPPIQPQHSFRPPPPPHQTMMSGVGSCRRVGTHKERMRRPDMMPYIYAYTAYATRHIGLIMLASVCALLCICIPMLCCLVCIQSLSSSSSSVYV